MKTFDVETLQFEKKGECGEALLHSSGEVRVLVLRVPGGASWGPLRSGEARLFLTCLHTAGARLHLGPRIFRPLPGQVFEAEPGEVLGVGNDTRQEVRFLVTRIGGGELQAVGQTWEEYLREVRPDEPHLLSTTSNPAAR